MENILLKAKRVHFVGIGGIGMSGLALILKDKGFKPQGSDISDNSNVKMLEAEGIPVYIGHSASFINSDIDLVVYSSAVKEDNPEIREAEKQGIPLLKRGQLLALLSRDRKTIAIAGSHGKTTTTSLIGYLLTSLRYDPTVFIGGVSLNYSRNAWNGKDYFVIETDESDGSFLYYNPWCSLITNVDYEHIDYYKNMGALRDSFLQFASQTKEKIFVWGDDANIKDFLGLDRVVTYGLSEGNTIRAVNLVFYSTHTCFDLVIGTKQIISVKSPLLGVHNVLNLIAVLGLFDYLGEDLMKVLSLLANYKGVKRRFQIKGTVQDICFVDDYAHHPKEIQATLQAAKALAPKRIVAVFQPHRYSRIKLLYSEFSRCFYDCDCLVVTDIYSAGEPPVDGIDSCFLFKEISKYYGGSIYYIPRENLIREVVPLLKDGDLVIGLGAGDINLIIAKVMEEYKSFSSKNIAV
ncbi:MAG: UDP-N-acetylmuramate--L-alanine ligase [Candidatus Omnitrophota bacterium]